jgi:superfamily II DNA or RNA helicase
MPLSSQFSRLFSKSSRSRGEHYFQAGLVHIEHGSAGEMEAIVNGTRDYFVSFECLDGILSAACECPHFSDDLTPCKHLWAALLAADKDGWLSGVKAGYVLHFDFDEFDPASLELEVEGRVSPGHSVRETLPVPHPRAAAAAKKARLPARPEWKKQLDAMQSSTSWSQTSDPSPWPPEREIHYVVDVPRSYSNVAMEIMVREPKKTGGWSKFKAHRIPLSLIPRLPDPVDQEIMAALAGARDEHYYYGYGEAAGCRLQLPVHLSQLLFPKICLTGRCWLRLGTGTEFSPLWWDDGPPWEFRLRVTRQAEQGYLVQGVLQRDEHRLPARNVRLLDRGGLVFTDEWVGRLAAGRTFDWASQWRPQQDLWVPLDQGDAFVEELLHLQSLPPLDLPEELRLEEVFGQPSFHLRLRKPGRPNYYSNNLKAQVFFEYEGKQISCQHGVDGLVLPGQRRFLRRDRSAEDSAMELLKQLGFRPPTYGYSSEARADLELAPKRLPRAVQTLVAAGWRVEAEGKLYRQPGRFQIEVRSGIDWFELHGAVDFGGAIVKLPALLAALKRGENIVVLGDGSFGMLPEEWLKKYGLLVGLGSEQPDHLQFRKSQAGLLDALLAAQPEATCDEVFEHARKELRRFEGIQPADPPEGFQGSLRGYQREGLGWLHFLRHFGFGGCLADDMGLGKTVQVLALLESRRRLRGVDEDAERSAVNEGRDGGKRAAGSDNGGKAAPPRPSLVVVPRSLVFNWKQEASRFTPELRILDHTGIDRYRDVSHFEDYDVVLTTYGTLRRDAALLKDARFDYVILDESQAIKNASTESAKAARLLQAGQRLALSGTPVENHLGELWSLFEFLNPGMLGSASVFRQTATGAQDPDEETRRLLAQALRPFILRRTKSQVARDLPEKLEQTLYCELESVQRRLYDDLKEHYRQSLLGRIESQGLRKVKIHVLEALLRLRQAACHPGLIDKSRIAEPSAKLDMLIPQVVEVLEEDHKVLVFSQFTSLLTIVRARLEAEGVRYLYLDGSTRNRGELVDRFQNDPAFKLFLISLKAGGLGLNLTAAEYVFLLDPWWNPAVEAQAIDRTHRIGQIRQVFAYRIIARDTVEEKVLQLQQSKRDLADAIISEDNSLIRDLGREELELLLS